MFELNFKVLANYNKTTNEYMNNYIMKISEAQWDKDLNGYFKSIHELCSHIYICDFTWLKRFSALREFKTLNNTFFDKAYTFKETLFCNIQEYIQLRNELDNIIISFINELDNNDLDSILKFTDSKGTEIERNMQALILHVFTHEVHHRGMISLYLEQLGIENGFSGSLYKVDL